MYKCPNGCGHVTMDDRDMWYHVNYECEKADATILIDPNKEKHD